VHWCNDFKIAGTDAWPSDYRYIYNQLKNVSANQNDKPAELEFYKREMSAYSKELGSRNGQFTDRIILWFNANTNSHGQSWLRALILLMLTICVIYFPIKILLGFEYFDLDQSLTAVSEMVECFNPVRKFTDSYGQTGMKPDEWRMSLAKLLDIVFMRLCVGLLIFQMVKAFRKYVK